MTSMLMHMNCVLLCFSNIVGRHGHPWRLSSIIWGGGEGGLFPSVLPSLASEIQVICHIS